MLSFEQAFGRRPAVISEAPGRVNLLGEHTDYTGGWVLPIATAYTTRVELAPSGDAQFHLYSANLGQRATFVLSAPVAPGFQRYAFGCIAVLEQAGFPVPPLCLRIESSVPMGVGLSSSAAFEVALLRAIREFLGLALTDIEIALLAQRAEVEHAGVLCGVMDQMASSLGDAHHMLYLDTRSLEYQHLPLPAGSEVIVLDSGVSRELATTAYNLRRKECEIAAHLLHVGTLREAGSLAAIEALPEPYNKRARHVRSENLRVQSALAANAEGFGALMNASHASLRDDYEVSSAALDALAASLQSEPAVFGAKLTGAGFGGACVALVRAGEGAHAAAAALAKYQALGFRSGRAL